MRNGVKKAQNFMYLQNGLSLMVDPWLGSIFSHIPRAGSACYTILDLLQKLPFSIDQNNLYVLWLLSNLVCKLKVRYQIYLKAMMNLEFRPEYRVVVDTPASSRSSSMSSLSVGRTAPPYSASEWGIYNHFEATSPVADERYEIRDYEYVD